MTRPEPPGAEDQVLVLGGPEVEGLLVGTPLVETVAQALRSHSAGTASSMVLGCGISPPGGHPVGTWAAEPRRTEHRVAFARVAPDFRASADMASATTVRYP